MEVQATAMTRSFEIHSGKEVNQDEERQNKDVAVL
jgi:hypothetical protein